MLVPSTAPFIGINVADIGDIVVTVVLGLVVLSVPAHRGARPGAGVRVLEAAPCPLIARPGEEVPAILRAEVGTGLGFVQGIVRVVHVREVALFCGKWTLLGLEEHTGHGYAGRQR